MSPETDPSVPAAASGRVVNAVWLLVLGAASSVWCATAAQQLGPTFDEPLYVRIGLESWRTGSTALFMKDGVMPLPADVQTLPVYLGERSRGTPYDPVAELPRLLPTARAGTLVFWWALLVYGFRWGHAWGGNWGGRLACGLIATDPNLLGHAPLATTDVAMTATVLIATFHFFRGRGRGPWPRVVLPGLLYGVALSAKASSLTYVPLLFTVVEMHRLSADGRLPCPVLRRPWGAVRAWWAATWPLRRDLCSTFGIALAWVLLYTGSDWKPEPQFARWAASLEPGPSRDAFAWLAERGCACFPNALEGLGRQVNHGIQGHDGAVILGERQAQEKWYYFPVTLAIKLPDSTLALVPVAMLLNPGFRRSPLAWATGVLWVFSLTIRVQIGIRIVFPLVAFTYVALGVALATTPAAGRKGFTRRHAAFAAGFAAMLYSAVLAVGCWPDGIRFTNQMWGGPDRGAEVLGDSNYDWGQCLPELMEWSSRHGDAPLYLWYYGCDPRRSQPPFRGFTFQGVPSLSIPLLRGTVGDGYFAVSHSIMHGDPDWTPETMETLAWLRSLTPVARTRTAFIYKVN